MTGRLQSISNPLFFAGVLLFAIGLPLSMFLMSVSQLIIIVAWLFNGDLKEKLKKSTSDLAVASTFSNDIEISDIEAQKGLILAKTIKKMGIDKSEVIVLGDSFNDYSMFTEFENSYAMENAIPEIKEIAKYITDSNNNDGVAKAIYKSLEV